MNPRRDELVPSVALQTSNMHHLSSLLPAFSRLTLRLALLIAALTFGHARLSAQRIIGELESNTDQDMLQGDTIDADEKKPKLFVPVDVRSWTIHPVFGTRTEVDVDTLRHNFQNLDHNEGPTGHYNTLSNAGSPRLSRLFFERSTEEYIFLSPFDMFNTPIETFRFYNTKSPYMNLTYHWAGDRENGDDNFRALFTNNIGSRFNFGGIFHYLYGKGYYDHQSTSFMNGTGFASYTGDRYDLHFRYTHNFMKLSENGGISDDAYITNPESLDRSYRAHDIPTRLTKTWNRQESDFIDLNHRYHIGFVRADSDSIRGAHDRFVPVTSVFHRMQIRSTRRNFRSYENPVGTFYARQYMPGDSAQVRDRLFEMRNNVGLSLREGFNKYAVAGLSAYIGFWHRSYDMPDSVATADGSAGALTRTRFKLNNILLGGEIIRTQGNWINYTVNGEYVIGGDDAGEWSADATAELNVPVLGDTATLALSARLSHACPSTYYDTYHSKYAWWDRENSPEDISQLSATLTIPHTRTELSVALANHKGYAYLSDEGTAITNAAGAVTGYTHLITSHQYDKNIQVVSATLKQDFQLGPVHLDNEITYQQSSQQDILPLPKLNLYHNLYLDFRLARVLSCQIGADLTFFTKYHAEDYSPATGLFHLQNAANRMEIGGYPLISAYANFHLKRTRFYVAYYHINQSEGRSFWAPHYPMNPKGLRFGISWNFYN